VTSILSVLFLRRLANDSLGGNPQPRLLGGSVDVIVVLVSFRQPRKSHEIKANGYCFDIQDFG
jgi:hypothetical protein